MSNLDNYNNNNSDIDFYYLILASNYGRIIILLPNGAHFLSEKFGGDPSATEIVCRVEGVPSFCFHLLYLFLFGCLLLHYFDLLA